MSSPESISSHHPSPLAASPAAVSSQAAKVSLVAMASLKSFVGDLLQQRPEGKWTLDVGGQKREIAISKVTGGGAKEVFLGELESMGEVAIGVGKTEYHRDISIPREESMLKRLKGKTGIVQAQFFPCWTGTPTSAKLMVMPRYVNDLYDVMDKLTFDQQLIIARDLLEGLDAIHAEGIIHRDIKVQNVLIGQNYRAYIADFDTAIMISEENLKQWYRGTYQFWAPEYTECFAEADREAEKKFQEEYKTDLRDFLRENPEEKLTPENQEDINEMLRSKYIKRCHCLYADKVKEQVAMATTQKIDVYSMGIVFVWLFNAKFDESGVHVPDERLRAVLEKMLLFDPNARSTSQQVKEAFYLAFPSLRLATSA